MSGGGNLLCKLMLILFFKRVSRFEVFQERELKEMLAVSYLVLQACVSFFEAFQTKWRTSFFLPSSHT